MPRYSHKRAPAAHTSSIQFDAGVSDRKPTAAKSAGTLGKWGVTSFTSIRSSIVNGSARSGHDSSADGRVASPPAPPADAFSFQSNTPGAAPVRKVKKFFKSRNAPSAAGAGAADTRRQLSMTRPPPTQPSQPPTTGRRQNADEKPEEPESKRFFSSPAVPQPLRDTTTNRANSLSPREPPAAPQAPRMPPLKLRISRDKDTGDLTAVSGPPEAAEAAEGGGGGGRRRRQPAAAPAPQPTKAARYKSPPPVRAASPVGSPPPPPPAEEGDGGGRGVRRTRRAAAVEARQRVAKTVQYGEDDDEDDVVPAMVAPVRGRRGQRRRSSASDPPAPAPPAAPAAPAVTNPDPEPQPEPELEPEPKPEREPESEPVPSPVENGSPGSADSPGGAHDAADSPVAEDNPPTEVSSPTVTQPEQTQTSATAAAAQAAGQAAKAQSSVGDASSVSGSAEVPVTKMPVLTPAPTLLQSSAPPVPVLTPSPVQPQVQPQVQTSVQTSVQGLSVQETSHMETAQSSVSATAQQSVQSHVQPSFTPPVQSSVQSSVQPSIQSSVQPPVPPTAQSQIPPTPQPGLPSTVDQLPPVPAPVNDQSSEPVNLSTRRPAADLERQLSSLFGEPPPAAAAQAQAAEVETTSKIYRKGIKDLGRYQRTQETRGDPAAGSSSPQWFQELETQLELMEAGRAPPSSAPALGLSGSDSGIGGSSQDSDPAPVLSRASTEPVMAHNTRSTRSAAAAAAAAAAAGSESVSAPGAPQGGGKAAPAETKKGSIFKTRTGQSRAARARYNHRWTDDKEEAAPPKPAAAAPAQTSDAPSALSALDFSDDPAPPGGPGGGVGGGPISGRLTRVSTWHGSDPNSSQQPVTSVKVDRRAKEYYTVIQNVKKAYQIQEFGEFQEYNDDIDYIMDALQPTNSLSTRCLSATRLAGKCMVAAFRMHLRAHGTVTRFFAALSDAPSDPCLSLCTSAVMFILSEDQLNMDLDKSSLELMLSLLDSDSSAAESDESNAELNKNRAKVRELCAQLQRQGQAKQLQLDNITAGHLSMETLLSLTSQRAGAWFKEELRELGGLDRLLGTVSESLRTLRQPRQLGHQRDTIARINRCLRVVENVTSRNEDNQRYLLQAAGGQALQTLSQLFQLAETELTDCTPADFQAGDAAARVLLEMTETLMKVLVNLSSAGHSSSRPLPSSSSSCSVQTAGGALLGGQAGLLESLLHAVLRLPDRLPEERQFDVLLLAMYLLMNLAEGGGENRQRIATAAAPPRHGQIMDVSPAGSALCELLQMFYRLVRLASEVETHTDRILDGSVPATPPTAASAASGAGQQDSGEVTATALIQKAGHHMEKTVIAAYIGVLVGHLAMNNVEHEASVRSQLTGGRFSDVVDVLRKLLSFMDLTNTGRPETLHEMRTMRRVIDFMTRADQAGQSGPPPPSAAAPAPAPVLQMGLQIPTCEDLGVLDMSL